ncbi:MAG: hypothetical protein Ta2B_07480 [Termitinemataceae bacterium]|nr:MAG: hypothetical protein Ta2B_07480 [Termitinemataceae bacterium]
MKKLLTLFLVLIVQFGVFADTLPDWFIPLRDSVYEQKLSTADIEKLAKDIEKKSRIQFTGFALDTALSRIEYFKGRAYQNDKKNSDAVKHYNECINLSEKSIKVQPTSSAYELIAASTMELCKIKDKPWVMARRPDIQKNSELALSLNGGSGSALYMIKSRWIFSTGTFADISRGISELTDLLNSNNSLQKDDFFNINLTIGYAYLLLKKKSEAEPWLKKAAEYYPTNQYVKDLLEDKINLARDS